MKVEYRVFNGFVMKVRLVAGGIWVGQLYVCDMAPTPKGGRAPYGDPLRSFKVRREFHSVDLWFIPLAISLRVPLTAAPGAAMPLARR